MTTIPARLAQMSRTSGGNSSVQRDRVFKMYRDWYRSAPEIVDIYGLNVTAHEIRHAIRQRFERNRYVSDPKVVDILLHKSRIEWQETMNCWKQAPHVLGIMLAEQARPPQTFLEKFYEGRDEDQVLPASPATALP